MIKIRKKCQEKEKERKAKFKPKVFKKHSKSLLLGIKYPQPKSSAESAPGDPPGLLREPGFVANVNHW